MATVKGSRLVQGAYHVVHLLDRAFDSSQQLDLYELQQAGLRIISERELAQHYYAGRSEGIDMFE